MEKTPTMAEEAVTMAAPTGPHKKNRQPHAAFAVVLLPSGRVAATTRPDGTVGLPGGKLERGEDPITAARRESFEEGWAVRRALGIIHRQKVDGKEVAWVLFERGFMLRSYKEIGRISSFEAEAADVASMGNAEAIEKAKCLVRQAENLRRSCRSRRQYVVATRRVCRKRTRKDGLR